MNVFVAALEANRWRNSRRIMRMISTTEKNPIMACVRYTTSRMMWTIWVMFIDSPSRSSDKDSNFEGCVRFASIQNLVVHFKIVRVAGPDHTEIGAADFARFAVPKFHFFRR